MQRPKVAGSLHGGEYEETLRRAKVGLAQTLPNNVQLDLGQLAMHYSLTARTLAHIVHGKRDLLKAAETTAAKLRERVAVLELA